MLVNEIYITHRLTFPKGMKNDAYKGGRRFSGIVLALSGTIDYIFSGGNVVKFCAGQMMYLPELSGYATENLSEDFEHYTLNFELCPGKDDAYNDEVCAAMFGRKPTVIVPDSFSDTVRLFEKAVASRRTGTCGDELLCRAVIYELLHMFARKISVPSVTSAVRRAVMPAKDYIDGNFCDDCGMEFLAELCSMSETHFRRRFREAFGVSPSDYRQGLRLGRAKELLLTRLYRVSEVSELCGYNDANYFARIFKAKTGVTPQEFMNSR